jgi:hypothetical protein
VEFSASISCSHVTCRACGLVVRLKRIMESGH